MKKLESLQIIRAVAALAVTLYQATMICSTHIVYFYVISLSMSIVLVRAVGVIAGLLFQRIIDAPVQAVLRDYRKSLSARLCEAGPVS